MLCQILPKIFAIRGLFDFIAPLGWFSTVNGMEQFKDADYQITAFYEKLLPILIIPDLYHLFAGMTVPLNDWGTLGFFVNFVSFGSTVASGDVDADDLVA